MNIKLPINGDESVTITKSNNFGYNLQHNFPTFNVKTLKAGVGSKTTFHANLEQVAERIIWLGLDGEGIQQVIDSMVALSERLEDTLEKMV